MKKAIVTGATGFIGSAVTKELLKNGYEVWALCRPSSIHKLPLCDKLHGVEWELESTDYMKTEERIGLKGFDAFFHFAWSGSGGEYRTKESLQINNAKSTINAMYFASYIECNKFVCAGSILENDSLYACYSRPDSNPNNIYGNAKVLAHTMCVSLAKTVGIDLIWGKITNAYGVGEVSKRLVVSTLQKCLNNESPSFSSATQNYDFVYIDDVALAFRLLSEKGHTCKDYVIGSSVAKPLKDFLLDMKETVAPDLEFRFGNEPLGVHLPIEAFDCTETEIDTGFRAVINFKTGCKLTQSWLCNNKGKYYE